MAKRATSRKKKPAKRKTTKRKATKKKTTKRKPARKTAKRKTTKRKTAKKKAPQRKAAAKKPAKKTTAVSKKPMTKTQIFTEIADQTGLARRDVSEVFECLSDVIERHVKKKAVGHFTLPGLLKIKAVKRPARPARKNVPNPFRPGEFMDIAARPATMKVKVLPLKRLKEMVL